MTVSRDIPTLIELNESTATSNIFCIHAAGGGVSFYDFVAKQLAPQAKFYGLEEPLIYDGFDYSSIPELAEYHIDTIQEVQGEGPYTLFAYCSAGPIAYEIANQLSLIGEKVEKVVFFGSQLGIAITGKTDQRFLFLKDYLGEKFELDLEGLDWPSFEQKDHNQVSAAIIGHLASQGLEGVEADWVSAGIKSLSYFRDAMNKYKPTQAAFDIDVYDRLVSEQAQPNMTPWCDWQKITRGKLHFVQAPPYQGDHNDVLKPPYVDKTVNRLKASVFGI